MLLQLFTRPSLLATLRHCGGGAHRRLLHSSLRRNAAAAVISGQEIADRILDRVRRSVSKLKRPPLLVSVLVGDDAESLVYTGKKREAAARVGISMDVMRLPTDVTADRLCDKIDGLNRDGGVHGVIVQLPLPEHLDEIRTCNLVAPEKDVDGFTAHSLGSLVQSANSNVSFLPSTALAVRELLSASARRMETKLAGKRAVVIGRSLNVGLPIALLLQADSKKGGFDLTTTICHRSTRDLAAVTREADVLVCAAGVRKLVAGDAVKPGAIVIDVGLNRVLLSGGKSRIFGDVCPDVADVAAAVTPVPGGVGPCTVACLLYNTALAADRLQKR